MKLIILGFVVGSRRVAAAESDCQCFNGFEADVMPRMNITNFEAVVHPKESSM